MTVHPAAKPRQVLHLFVLVVLLGVSARAVAQTTVTVPAGTAVGRGGGSACRGQPNSDTAQYSAGVPSAATVPDPMSRT